MRPWTRSKALVAGACLLALTLAACSPQQGSAPVAAEPAVETTAADAFQPLLVEIRRHRPAILASSRFIFILLNSKKRLMTARPGPASARWSGCTTIFPWIRAGA